MKWLGIVLLAMIALSVEPVLADEQYRTTIVGTHGSPVQLNGCEVWARDANKTVLVAHASDANALMDVGVNFTNASAKRLRDVQFGFTAYDAFGSVLSSIHLAVSQDVSAEKVSMDPGTVVDLMGPKGWHGTNSKSAKDHVVCSVEKVAFDDSTVWVNGGLPPPASPSPSPSGSNSSPRSSVPSTPLAQCRATSAALYLKRLGEDTERSDLAADLVSNAADWARTDRDGKQSVAECLMKMKDFRDAKTMYVSLAKQLGSGGYENIEQRAAVFWQLALVEERFGDLVDARHNIQIAKDNSDQVQPAFGVDIHRDYNRLQRAKVEREQAKNVAVQRAYWDSLSADERSVVAAHGGTRDETEPGQPCHTEEFDSALGHEETWWYCAGDSYSEAYTFQNDRLISHYVP